MSCITRVIKRDKTAVPFDKSKIAEAIFAAARAVGGENRQLADDIADLVVSLLEKRYGSGDQAPGIEDIQDMVEKALIETGHAKTAKAFILYRQRRGEARNRMRVRKDSIGGGTDSTDIHLLVDPGAQAEYYTWDRRRITDALVKEAGLSRPEAASIAKTVEARVYASGKERMTTSLIRELVDNELFERGHQKSREKQAIIGLPKFDIEQLILSKSKENSNIAANNPEAINLAIAETVLKQYALQEVYSSEVADAHREGAVHIHDLGYPTRVYCSSHSVEYLKKYGLQLENLDTSSAPAKHARTLTGHVNTFLASMQAYYAGALGVAYINIMYAPLVEGMSDAEMRQEAQHLIFSSSQNAFSRGGQTLFLDFNIHTGIPAYLKNIPAIGPGGKYLDRTYGDFADAATRFTKAMLDVWAEGDQHGHIFAFPKCDFHINHETFTDPKQYAIYQYACEIAARNGTPYFIFDRDEVTLSACCRLRTVIEDTYMIRHPESMRFCGFQNVTINLPQCAYKAGRGNYDKVFPEIEKALDVCLKAHQEKKKFAKILMSGPSMPLWQVGKVAADGRPYIDLDQATYIVGVIGLNECLAYLTGHELHEDEQTYRLGVKIISHLYFCIKEMNQKHGMKITIEESPAESAARRLAKIDLKRYPDAADFIRGAHENDEIYYTNSVHLRPDAPDGIVDRINKQAAFHSLIESGAIIHAFVGESRPSAGAIASLVQKTFEKTKAAQLTISPEFTICRSCHRLGAGISARCPHCGAINMRDITRVQTAPGETQGWNRDALAELGRLELAGVGAGCCGN